MDCGQQGLLWWAHNDNRIYHVSRPYLATTQDVAPERGVMLWSTGFPSTLTLILKTNFLFLSNPFHYIINTPPFSSLKKISPLWLILLLFSQEPSKIEATHFSILHLVSDTNILPWALLHSRHSIFTLTMKASYLTTRAPFYSTR